MAPEKSHAGMKCWENLGGSENAMGQAAFHFWGPGEGQKVEKLRKITILGSKMGQRLLFHPTMEYFCNLRKKLHLGSEQ